MPRTALLFVILSPKPLCDRKYAVVCLLILTKQNKTIYFCNILFSTYNRITDRKSRSFIVNQRIHFDNFVLVLL